MHNDAYENHVYGYKPTYAYLEPKPLWSLLLLAKHMHRIRALMVPLDLVIGLRPNLFGYSPSFYVLALLGIAFLLDSVFRS